MNKKKGIPIKFSERGLQAATHKGIQDKGNQPRVKVAQADTMHGNIADEDGINTGDLKNAKISIKPKLTDRLNSFIGPVKKK